MRARGEAGRVEGRLDGRGVIDRASREGWDDGADEAQGAGLLGGDLGISVTDEFLRAAQDAAKASDEKRLRVKGRGNRSRERAGGRDDASFAPALRFAGEEKRGLVGAGEQEPCFA